MAPPVRVWQAWQGPSAWVALSSLANDAEPGVEESATAPLALVSKRTGRRPLDGVAISWRIRKMLVVRWGV